MASIYYDSSGKEVVDGDVAYASDLNDVNTAVNTAFEQVETDISTVSSNQSYYSDLAQQWATEVEDTQVTPGKYSAFHWAQKTDDDAIATAADRVQTGLDRSAASGSASTASGSATNASNSAIAASGSAITALGHANAALGYSNTAAGHASDASDSADAAAASAGLFPAIVSGDANKVATVRDDENGLEYLTLDKTSVGLSSVDNVSVNARVAAPVNTISALGSISGSYPINTSTHDTFSATIASTTTFSFTNMTDGRTISLVLTNPGTKITWPSAVKWPNGTSPTFSTTGVDRVVLQQVSSTIIHANLAGKGYA